MSSILALTSGLKSSGAQPVRDIPKVCHISV
jgi:hypothetical protein